MPFHFRKIKNQRILLGGIFSFGLVFIIGSFLTNLSFPDSSYNFLGKSREVRLDPGKPVIQMFTAKENHLNQIKIIVGNTDVIPREKIVFELLDGYCENVLATQTHRFFNLPPHIYYRFNFSEISDSRNKTYCLRITYFSPFDRGADRPYLEATRDEEEAFMGWSFYDEGNQKLYENRTLKMRPAYGTGSFWGDLRMLNNRLSQYKPEVAKGLILPLLGLFILGSIVLGYWIIRSDFRKS